MQIEVYCHGAILSVSRIARVDAGPLKHRKVAGLRVTAAAESRVLKSPAMKFPPADLSFLRERLGELATQLTEFWETSGQSADEADNPQMLGEAVEQLFAVLGHIEDRTGAMAAETTEINTLTEYGLHLLEELAKAARSLRQFALATEIEQLAVPLALWAARHGGEIRNLSPVVNAVAHFANRASHPHTMAELYAQCCELIDATSPMCEAPAVDNPRDPWRLLLINRAIVATRSHNPELIESAFDAVLEGLPGDAPKFFAEGMEQMTTLDYPDDVREVVRRYYLAHAVPRRLH